MRMLNIGCGSTYHKDWVNVDIKANSAEVIQLDLTKGLPYPDGSFDVCYSSHVLEHLWPEEADVSLREQFRVLRPGGIIRVVVPDLEQICRNYLIYLDDLTAGNNSSEFRYDYTLLEMYDQVTRNRSGGELGRLWRSGRIPDADFVRERHGHEALIAIQKASTTTEERRGGVERRIPNRWRRPRRRDIAEALVRKLLGPDAVRALREGLFRNSGEIHRVMYDRYSLPRLLKRHGFENAHVCEAVESGIPDFSRYELDTIRGEVRKPDSLFVEAVRPG